MIEPIFFEIPIYRVSLTKYTAQQEQEKDRFANPENEHTAPESYRSAVNYFESALWYPWQYNEVIGYLGLYIMGGQFRADYWKIQKHRYNKGILAKKFICYGRAFEKQIPANADSTEIFQLMRETIVKCNKRDFKRFFFDLAAFDIIAPYVDWLLLTKKLNSFAYPEIRREYFNNRFNKKSY